MALNNTKRLEAALPKAQDLAKIGKPNDAIQVLINVLAVKTTVKTWSTDLESAVLMFIELAAQLHWKYDVRAILTNYRSCTLSSNQSTYLIKALRYLIELAEKQVGDSLSLALEDEDNFENETPESLAFHAFNTTETKERRDRLRVNPASRFLWDSYRTVLDITRINNGKLLEVYHEIARKWLRTCLVYKRKSEFRRFALLFRDHTQNPSSRDTSAVGAIVPHEETSLQLETRFQQLSTASSLGIWAEAYSTIEDIHNSKNFCIIKDASILLRIFDKLAVFFCENKKHLYYAYTVIKFYTIASRSPAVFEETKRLHLESTQDEFERSTSLFNGTIDDIFSLILVSALAVNPDLDSINDNTYSYSDVDPNIRLQSLLSPNDETLSRQHLFDYIADIMVPSKVDKVFTVLEDSNSPFAIKKIVLPILEQLEANSVFTRILGTLRETIVLRLLQRLSQLYTTVTMDHFISLAPSKLTWSELESVIITSVAAQQVQVRIDHRERLLHFTSDSIESPSMSTMLVSLTTALSRVAERLDDDEETEIRAGVFESILAMVPQDVEEALEQTKILAQRKEVEKKKIEKISQEIVAKDEEQRKTSPLELEERRKAVEEEKAAEARRKAEAERDIAQRRQMAEVITKSLAAVESEDANLKATKRLAYVLKHIETIKKSDIIEAVREFERAKRVEKRKRTSNELKTLDYTTRAIRMVDNEERKSKESELRQREDAIRQERASKILAKHKEDWEVANAEKIRLSRMESARALFLQQVANDEQ